jgi:hypothetical protein
MGDVIDAVERFERIRHKNLVLVVADEFINCKIDLDDFVWEMYNLGFDNCLTKVYSENENTDGDLE